MAEQILDLLARLSETSQLAEQMANRDMSVKFCITTGIVDPLDLRRIRVTTAEKGGATQTDWMMRILPCPYWDPPMPTIGMSVAAESFDGNPHDAAYLGPVVNNTNPIFSKKDPFLDDWRYIPGHSTLEVGQGADYSFGDTYKTEVRSGDWTITVSSGRCLIEGPSASIEIDNGQIRLNATQSIAMIAPQGITLNGSLMNVAGGRWSIDGREIAVIGAVDTDSDALVTSGQ